MNGLDCSMNHAGALNKDLALAYYNDFSIQNTYYIRNPFE